MMVSWFSAGVSSAVATKLALKEHPDMRVIYTHIDDQHPDSMRFLRDCEAWFGVKIEILQSPLRSVESACRSAAYINGTAGAACTGRLKRRVRKEWESSVAEPLVYVWGLDASENHRADRIVSSMPKQDHRFPLIEQNISKEHAHQILEASGIKRPAMYDMGYRNNNCVGCVKGGAGYWNAIRQDFPCVFAARAKMERDIGACCLGSGRWLDELSPDVGRDQKEILSDCGIMCEVMAI